MMEESPEEAAKREGMLKMYHACKESLRIIGMFDKVIECLCMESNELIFSSILR